MTTAGTVNWPLSILVGLVGIALLVWEWFERRGGDDE